MKRSRWAAIGAAVAVTIGSGGLMSASADISSGEKPVFVSITPCRIVDTRPTETVGARNTPLGANDTYSFAVRGTNGNCTIPADAVGVAVNVAAVQPTASSFFTLYPADAPTRPLAANLNFVAGQPPVSNSASIRLSADGRMSIYNLAGTVHFTLDITGYYVSHNHNDLYYTKSEVDAKMFTTANIPDYDATGGLTNADIGVFYAQINADGSTTTTSNSGGVTAVRLGVGLYEVDFSRNVTQCGFTATQGEAGIGGAPGAIIGVTDRAGNAEAAFVRVLDSAGAAVDRAFQIMVVC